MIAVDVMGGDRAPGVIVQGAVRAAQKVPVLLVGPEREIRELLYQIDPGWEARNISVCDAPQVIDMGEEPVAAVRKKGASSLVKAVSCVKEGKAVAVLSAGNSGALMVAATFILGREESLERPAIAGFFPSTTERKALVLDLGANTECRAHHLEQFAHHGSAYVSTVLGIERPSVALLANGTENTKGSLLTKEAFALLQKSSLNFLGNAEPFDVFQGCADVVVCDGFAGNVLLKTMEASFELFAHIMQKQIEKEPVTSVWKSQLQLWSEYFLQDAFYCLGHRKYGGALLLGVKGNVMVCHGNSDAQTIENAILFAWKSFSV
jgi:glycerol-3-phosphate acyltransferase PlsX